jgi:hypothetical protein
LLADLQRITLERTRAYSLFIQGLLTDVSTLTKLKDQATAIEARVTTVRAGLAGAGLIEHVRFEWLDGQDWKEARSRTEAEFLEWWGRMDLDRRRELVRSMMDIRIAPKDDPFLEPEEPITRVVIDWKTRVNTPRAGL